MINMYTAVKRLRYFYLYFLLYKYNSNINMPCPTSITPTPGHPSAVPPITVSIMPRVMVRITEIHSITFANFSDIQSPLYSADGHAREQLLLHEDIQYQCRKHYDDKPCVQLSVLRRGVLGFHKIHKSHR